MYCDGCQGAPRQPVAATVQTLQGPQQDVADLCGFICAERGLETGNAAISGVSSPDALFSAVVGFTQASDALAASLEDQLRAIASDFGVSGEAGAGIAKLTMTFAQGPLRVRAGQAHCSLDAASLLDAQARCDDKLERKGAIMRCAGSCELEADSMSAAQCPKGATLRCTQPSAARCDGLCRGTCTTPISGAVCQGECRGSCDGTCLASSADGKCAGACDGKCSGQCSLQELDPIACDGPCDGQCVVDNPAGGCDSALAVACVVPATGESVACAGRCVGEALAADGRPECMLAAKAQSTLELACRPGAVSVAVFPASMPKDAQAQSRYLAAVANLERRLPALLMLAERGERLFSLGDDLRKAADDAMLVQSFTALNTGDLDARFAVGLQCAADQLPAIAQVVDKASPRLQAALDAVDALRRGLGLQPP
jgi:hypothetical protein